MVKVIEARLPLAWLIGSASAIVFSMGGVYFKVDALGRALEKQETKLEKQQAQIDNATIEGNRNSYYITSALASITEIKNNLNELRTDFKSTIIRIENRR